MKKITVLLSLFITFSVVIAGAGDGVGTGSGIAEKNIIFAHLNMDKYLSLCLMLPSCRLTDQEKEILTSIKNTLPEEGDVSEQLEFRSEKEDPGFFHIDGLVRIAKTGRTVGSKIYVNLDLLYPKNGKGKLEPLSFTSAIALLVHEFGHHHGVTDHTLLDVLGSKVETFVLRHSQTLSGYPYAEDVFITIIHFNMFPYSQVLVTDNKKTVDISKRILKQLSCPDHFQSHEKGEAVAFDFFNMHWYGRPEVIVTGPETVIEENGSVTVITGYPIISKARLWGRLQLDCRYPGGNVGYSGYADLALDIYFKTNKKGNIVFLPKYLKAVQIECTDANNCH